jgi:hypothetical protein
VTRPASPAVFTFSNALGRDDRIARYASVSSSLEALRR